MTFDDDVLCECECMECMEEALDDGEQVAMWSADNLRNLLSRLKEVFTRSPSWI